MKPWSPIPRAARLATPLALAISLAYPAAAMAQSNADVLKELQALKDRVAELEAKLKAASAAAPARPAGAATEGAQWGMTPEQAQEFNRIAVKTESIEDNLEAWGFKGLTVSGYIEPVFIYNRRQDRAGFQFLNDQADGYFYDTSFMGAASIDFTKETESGTRWKLTLTPNRGVGAAIGAGIVQEASVSVPLSDNQTRFIAGQVPDWSGYEYQQPTLNPFTTHNLLYDFTLPLGYTGVGVDITRGKWWVRSMIANVNATIRNANEKAPVIAYRVDYSKGEYNGFGFAGLHGKSPNFNGEGNATMAHLFEVDGYFIRGDWTVQGQVSVGQQKRAAITPDADGNYRDARWWGVSGLAGYAVTPRLQALLRADYLNNDKNGGGLYTYNGYSAVGEDGTIEYGNDGRNGLGPDLEGNLNKGANRYALTLGLKYAFNSNTTLKAEYRFDGADRKVFEDLSNDDGAYRKNNHLLGASVLVFF